MSAHCPPDLPRHLPGARDPARWHYDILRALDYFRDAGAERDPRLEEAIVRKRQRPDVRWTLPRGYTGLVFFELEKAGLPSRWNTLHALRVLNWWSPPEGGA